MKSINSENVKKDFAILKEEILKIHPNPYFNTSEEEFAKELDTLALKSHDLPAIDFYFELMRILALLNDSHTRVKGVGKLLSGKTYPFRIKILSNNFYIVATNKDNSDIVGSKLVSFNDINIEDVVKRFSKVLTHENEIVLSNGIEQWIYEPELLRYLDIVKKPLELKVEFETSDGNMQTVLLNPEEVDEDSLYGPRNDSLKKSETLNPKGLYWTRYYKDFATYYLQYNECEDVSETEINRIIDEFIHSGAKNIVVDLRNNIGGSSEILDPLTKYLYNNQDKYTPFVLISNITYSAAIINALNTLDCKNAVSIGTPTAGSPTKFGEGIVITLPHTGIEVVISTKSFIEKGYEYGQSLVPQILTYPSIDQYLNVVDVEWNTLMSMVSKNNEKPKESNT